MFLGYNTNVYYNGNIYHIQTEDSGIRNPVIISLIYLKGAIIASKKISYSHMVGEPDYRKKIKRLMEEQHRGMITELLEGNYTEQYKPEREAIE